MIPIPSERSDPVRKWQWTISSLLFLITVIAICAWLSTISRVFGFAACLITGPALLLVGLSQFRTRHSEGLKIWTFACLILAGATAPPLVIAMFSEKLNSTLLLQMSVASFSGVLIAGAYGFYLVLMASIFEAAFAVKNSERGDVPSKEK